MATDRGVPVARLGPAEEENLLDRLEREGVLTRARTKKRPIAKKAQGVKASGPVADLVSEMRRMGRPIARSGAAGRGTSLRSSWSSSCPPSRTELHASPSSTR